VAETDVLTQLKDIHLPSPVGWWPLAPGWYGVIGLVLCLVSALVYFFYKKHIHALPKKKALVLLASYIQHYETDRNSQLASARISELLKRVALVYYPRDQVASMHGDAWIDFLNRTGKRIDFNPVKAMLLDAPFKAAETVNLQPLISTARLWIKQRGVPCSN
jgi:hypothetical protein